jgi:tetraprenyl-beta-curcumene synthase
MFQCAMGPDRVASLAAFARATQSYWTSVFPRVSRELSHWRERALAIPDPALRAQALQALSKRGNMEGAAAFATFAPRARRGAVVRAAVAFQSAYNYLDTLSEQPSPAPLANSRRLHEALLVALACPREWDPSALQPDYYEHHCSNRRGRGDGGYLAALVDACRGALRELPSYPAVAPAARRAAERVVSFQAFNTGEVQGDREAMERWGRTQMGIPEGHTPHRNPQGTPWRAQAGGGHPLGHRQAAGEQTPPGIDLRWWETAASGGSSLGVHVMIAAAADPAIEPGQVDALENAYFPWIGALHSMLDHLIDAAEDARTGQRNLIDLYASPEQAAERMSLLAERALVCARSLPPAHRHELIVAAMASFYLSAPEAQEGEALPVTRAVLDAFGPLATPAMAVFKARRTAERASAAMRRDRRDDRAVGTLAVRSADA